MSPESNDQRYWVANLDAFTNAAGDLIIRMELAGLAREDLAIAMEGQKLKVAGERCDPDRAGLKKGLVLEVNFGPFENELEVPPEYDPTRAQITHQNGLLRMVVPKRLT